MIRRFIRLHYGPPIPFPVQMVTIPRSGHHLLVRMLQAIKPDLRYCEFYTEPVCCRRRPCRFGMDLQKSHDEDFTDRKIPDRRYIIQVRPIIPTLVSDFGLHARRNPDTQEEWRRFAETTILELRKPFVRKWLRRPPRHSLVVHYDDLTGDPCGTAERVGRWLWGDVTVPDLEPIKPARRIEDFHHYDPDYFARLTAMVRAEDRLIARAARPS